VTRTLWRIVTRALTGISTRVAAHFDRPLPMPAPGHSVTWWNIFTGDSHYYQLNVSLDADAAANGGMPWVLELLRDRQFYERKCCPDAEAARDLQAGWKRMAREHGLGRVFWVGSASMGRFDMLVLPRDGRWKLLLYIKDRFAEARTFATEAEAIAAGHALELDLRSRPWLALEVTAARVQQQR
jgi:hypothetical protein